MPVAPIAPDYPRLARARGYQGLVRVRAEIDPSGHVTRAEILDSSGHSLLDEAALQAVGRARFNAGSAGSMRVVIVPVRFGLSER
ncbi:energy transducer TonB [Salinispira pacifica]